MKLDEYFHLRNPFPATDCIFWIYQEFFLSLQHIQLYDFII